MRYNFKRLSGSAWYSTIRTLRQRGLTFLEVNSEDLYDREKVDNVYCAYFNRTSSRCRLIYYEVVNSKWKKRLSEISFSPREIDPVRCVLDFKKIAKSFNELEPYEPNKFYTNGVYTYYKGAYDGYVTVLDMNSAYLHALRQPLADWTTRTECAIKEVFEKKYDYYSFENDVWCELFYKEDIEKMKVSMIWADLKIYGYKSKLYYQKTAKELYRLKQEVNKTRYKNVANIAVGCMHKRSGKQNNTTIAASIYAWFSWYIDHLVNLFEKKGYDVIMVTTDSIKIKGKYNTEDNLVVLGEDLGEFKVEYEGEAKYRTIGHYTETKEKWKGKPQYMIDGYHKCQFIDNIDEEKEIYEKYYIK